MVGSPCPQTAPYPTYFSPFRAPIQLLPSAQSRLRISLFFKGNPTRIRALEARRGFVQYEFLCTVGCRAVWIDDSVLRCGVAVQVPRAVRGGALRRSAPVRVDLHRDVLHLHLLLGLQDLLRFWVHVARRAHPSRRRLLRHRRRHLLPPQRGGLSMVLQSGPLPLPSCNTFPAYLRPHTRFLAPSGLIFHFSIRGKNTGLPS